MTMQLCTAPPAVLGPIILGALGGELGAVTSLAIQGKIHKRDGIDSGRRSRLASEK